MIALDYTVIVQAVAFLVFWFLLTKLLFKPFVGLLEERERRTEGVKAEAAALREEGERLLKEYEYAIAKARDKARAAKEKIVQEGRQARERLLGQARGDASWTLEAVRAEIEKELQRGQEIAAGEAQAIAQQMAEKIIGRKIG